MIRKTLLFVSVALPFAASIAVAGPHHGRHGKSSGRRLEKAVQQLDLAPEQKTKVQAILDAAKEERAKARLERRDAFDQMRALLEQDAPNEAAVLSQADKIGALETEAHKSMLRTLLAVRAELTPEQRAKLKEMKASHRKHRERKSEAKGD